MVDLKNKTSGSAFGQRNKHQCRTVTDHKPAWYQLFCNWGARPATNWTFLEALVIGLKGFSHFSPLGCPEQLPDQMMQIRRHVPWEESAPHSAQAGPTLSAEP